MVGDDPLRKMETRLCEKRSQTGQKKDKRRQKKPDWTMQSEEETKKEPGSKSKVMQAYLHKENKILCIFGNLFAVFEF